MISYQIKEKAFDLVAEAALLQEYLSAIATLKNSGIDLPKKLNHKTYVSCKAYDEDGIAAQIIRNDGGTGNFEVNYTDKLGIYDVLLEEKADSTWIFNNWEGLKLKGQESN